MRIGACRALVRLLPLVARQQQQGVSQVLPSLYSGLVRLLGDSSEETLHLVLETLAAVVRNDKDAVITQVCVRVCVRGVGDAVTAVARRWKKQDENVLRRSRALLLPSVAQYLGEVLNPVLHVWQRSVADPLIGEDAFSVLAALAAQPPCLVPLVSHVSAVRGPARHTRGRALRPLPPLLCVGCCAPQLLPALVGVISAPKQQPPMMVEASLQLLRALIKRPTAATAAAQPAAGGAQPQPGAAAVGADAAAAQHAEVVRQVYVSCVVPVLALVDTADDSSIQQEAQQLLCQLVSAPRVHRCSPSAERRLGRRSMARREPHLEGCTRLGRCAGAVRARRAAGVGGRQRVRLAGAPAGVCGAAAGPPRVGDGRRAGGALGGRHGARLPLGPAGATHATGALGGGGSTRRGAPRQAPRLPPVTDHGGWVHACAPRPHAPQLLKAVCERLVRVNYASLVAGLIIVLSHLVNANCSGLLHALTQFNITTAGAQRHQRACPLQRRWC